MLENEFIYYSKHSIFTKIDDFSLVFKLKERKIEDIIKILCKIIQNICLHESDGNNFNYKIPQEKFSDVSLRYAHEMINKIFETNSLKIYQERKIENKLVVNCRNMTLILCSILRQMKIPARLRVGFMTYAFEKGNFKLDHTLLEYWNSEKNSWILVDPRISKYLISKKVFRNNFNPLDLQKSDFISASQAWMSCRQGLDDARNYGIGIFSHDRGLFVLRNKLMHDLACLNKMEMSPFDLWGYMLHDGPYIHPTRPEQLDDLDKIAEIINTKKIEFNAINEIFNTNSSVKVPSIILTNYPKNNPKSVEIKNFNSVN